MMVQTRKKAILIPNYNGAGFIASTISKFEDLLSDFTIIVIDDCSTDSSINVIEKTSCLIIKRKVNGGFAAAINTGFSYLIENNFEFVLVANSDLDINSTSAEQIRRSLSILDEDANVVALGYCESGSIRCLTNEDISGFLFALRLSIIDKIGYFDESFFMYGEEQDYFRRLIACGYKIHQTNIQVDHRKEGSGGGSLTSSWFAMRNALYLEAKRGLWRKMLHVFLVLFFTVNRVYRPHGYQQDPSYQRIIRPGIIRGNMFLIKALAWNFNNFLPNRKAND